VFLYVEQCFRVYDIMERMKQDSYYYGGKYINRVVTNVADISYDNVRRFDYHKKDCNFSEFEVMKLLEIVKIDIKNKDFFFFFTISRL